MLHFFCLKNRRLLNLFIILLLYQIQGCALPPLNVSDSPSVYVNGVGQGSSQRLALQEAFRDAIQKSLGVLVVSNITLDREILSKDKFDEYSSGFIERYSTNSVSVNDFGQYEISIDALVSSSKLSKTLVNSTSVSSTSSVSGEEIDAQVYSRLKSRIQEDAFLRNIGSQYLSNAFQIKFGAMGAVIDKNRSPYIEVPYSLSWNDDFIESMIETVKFVSEDNCLILGSGFPRCDYDLRFVTSKYYLDRLRGYKLSDFNQKNYLLKQFVPKVFLKITAYDSDRNPKFSSCTPIDISQGLFDRKSGTISEPLLSFNDDALTVYDRKIVSQVPLYLSNNIELNNLSIIDGKIAISCGNR